MTICYSPSFIFFLRPKVPNLSQIDSSLFLFSAIGRGDFGRKVAIAAAELPSQLLLTSMKLAKLVRLVRLKIKNNSIQGQQKGSQFATSGVFNLLNLKQKQHVIMHILAS